MKKKFLTLKSYLKFYLKKNISSDNEEQLSNNEDSHENIEIKPEILKRIAIIATALGISLIIFALIFYCIIRDIAFVEFVKELIEGIAMLTFVFVICCILAKKAKEDENIQKECKRHQIRAILPQYYNMFRTAILTYSEELHMKRIILNSKIKFKIININENNSTVRAVVEINPFRVNKKYIMKYAKLLSEKIEREIVSAIEDFYCEDLLNYSSFVTTKIYNRGYVLQIDFNIDNNWIVKIKNE